MNSCLDILAFVGVLFWWRKNVCRVEKSRLCQKCLIPEILADLPTTALLLGFSRNRNNDRCRLLPVTEPPPKQFSANRSFATKLLTNGWLSASKRTKLVLPARLDRSVLEFLHFSLPPILWTSPFEVLFLTDRSRKLVADDSQLFARNFDRWHVLTHHSFKNQSSMIRSLSQYQQACRPSWLKSPRTSGIQSMDTFTPKYFSLERKKKKRKVRKGL